jgi:cytochrome c oxidase assembly factor CtaG
MFRLNVDRLELTMILHLLIAALVLGASVFWVLMIIECATKEPTGGNDKLIWILIIIFTHWFGALIYYFVRRPQRIAEVGA